MAGAREARDTGGASAEAAFDALATLPKLSEISQVARAVLFEAAERRRVHYADAARVDALREEHGLSHEDCATPFGNALGVLGAGPEDASERTLVAALAAHALAEAPPKNGEADAAAIGDLLWLAAHASVDALPLLDRAMGDSAAELWRAVADAVRRIDAGKTPSFGRAEALVGAAALADASRTSAAARAAAKQLGGQVSDPLLARVLGGVTAVPAPEGADDGQRLEGELEATPRGPVATTALALTGLLFAFGVARLVGRFALSYRRPAEVVVTPGGVKVSSKTLLLGRTIREEEFHITHASLRRATREVRYPRAGLYTGLLALAVGSYLGLSLFVDGVRAASPSLLLTGLAFVAAGIGLDFALSSILSGARGRCRVQFLPSTGKGVCVVDVDPKRADEALALLRQPAAR
ncbi:MAG: hypothetical protein IPF92_02010 [Myxococcales bacterium]|nr:hypothetical protein [Myxococcales bacterium]MBL0193903.1 hypothetical protein [Myxococcales bacterium]